MIVISVFVFIFVAAAWSPEGVAFCGSSYMKTFPFLFACFKTAIILCCSCSVFTKDSGTISVIQHTHTRIKYTEVKNIYKYIYTFIEGSVHTAPVFLLASKVIVCKCKSITIYENVYKFAPGAAF